MGEQSPLDVKTSSVQRRWEPCAWTHLKWHCRKSKHAEGKVYSHFICILWDFLRKAFLAWRDLLFPALCVGMHLFFYFFLLRKKGKKKSIVMGPTPEAKRYWECSAFCSIRPSVLGVWNQLISCLFVCSSVLTPILTPLLTKELSQLLILVPHLLWAASIT